MQNNYIKELATKGYQEEAVKEYYRPSKRRFDGRSFMIGILLTSLVLSWLYATVTKNTHYQFSLLLH